MLYLDKIDHFIFPGGEVQLKVLPEDRSHQAITAVIKSFEDLIKLLMVRSKLKEELRCL